MAPISDTWPDVQLSLELLPHEFADRVTSLVEWLTPHFAHIESYARSLHPKKRMCRIVREHYTWGQSFVVFEVVFSQQQEDDDGEGRSSGEEEKAEVERSDGQEEEESWIVRFGMRPMDAYFNTAAQLERKILNEVAALHLVRTRTAIPVPRVIAYHPVAGDSVASTPAPAAAAAAAEHHPHLHQQQPQQPHGEHPLGPAFPAFVLMTAIRGITIEDCGIAIHELGHADPGSDPLQGDEAKRPILKQYLRDIADIHVQLSRITFDKIGGFVMDKEGNVSVGPGADFGLGPFDSAKEYFAIQAEAYERLAEAASETDGEEGGGGGGSSGGSGDGDESADLLKRRFVASLWRTAMMPLVDERDAGGPFPMRHGDLHSENILVDETGHIVGVLDWDCAATVPWEAFAVPTFEVSGHIGEPKSPVQTQPSATVLQKQGSGSEPEPADIQTQNSGSSEPRVQQPPRHTHKRSLSRPQVHSEFNKALAEIELQSSTLTLSDSGSQSSSSSSSPSPSSSSSSPLSSTVSLDITESQPQPPPVTASGRSLAALHDSDAGYVGAYLAYWMYSLACDYEETGRALHRMVVARSAQSGEGAKDEQQDSGVDGAWVIEGDMEEAFRQFVREVRGEAQSSPVH